MRNVWRNVCLSFIIFFFKFCQRFEITVLKEIGYYFETTSGIWNLGTRIFCVTFAVGQIIDLTTFIRDCCGGHVCHRSCVRGGGRLVELRIQTSSSWKKWLKKWSMTWLSFTCTFGCIGTAVGLSSALFCLAFRLLCKQDRDDLLPGPTVKAAGRQTMHEAWFRYLTLSWVF